MLALPILSRGTLRAVLLLENRLIRAAFTTERLDAVKLIASQLAVSLDNTQLYAELTISRARIATRWPPRRPAPWTSCASSPAACTRRTSPKAACSWRSRRSPAGLRSRSS
jgi:hypothetical protein